MEEKEIYELIQASFEENGVCPPDGKMPISEICERLEASGGSIGILASFLKNYFSRLPKPPGSWKHLTVSLSRELSKRETKDSIENERRRSPAEGKVETLANKVAQQTERRELSVSVHDLACP